MFELFRFVSQSYKIDKLMDSSRQGAQCQSDIQIIIIGHKLQEFNLMTLANFSSFLAFTKELDMNWLNFRRSHILYLLKK